MPIEIALLLGPDLICRSTCSRTFDIVVAQSSAAILYVSIGSKFKLGVYYIPCETAFDRRKDQPFSTPRLSRRGPFASRSKDESRLQPRCAPSIFAAAAVPVFRCRISHLAFASDRLIDKPQAHLLLFLPIETPTRPCRRL